MTVLYHGSPLDFDSPSLARAKMYRDFGRGFYLAENENDALTIAVKDSWDGYLYTYEIDDSALSMFNIVEFADMGEKWLSFVYNCRTGADNFAYDIIIGPTAGGSVNDIFASVRRNNTPFEQIKDRLSREITLTRFGWQWCIANDRVLPYMTLIVKEHVSR